VFRPESNSEENNMDWSAQTNEMMKTWGEAQKQLWSGWMSLAQGANLGQAGQMFDPTQWLRTNVDTWSGLREGPAQRLAGNILGTPEVMTRSMNTLMQAWGAVAPKIEQGQPWQPDLQKLLAKWREELASAPQRAASLQGDFAQLSKSLFERWTPVTGPLLSMVSQATAGGHPGAAFLSGTAGPGRMMGFGEMFQSPFSQLSVGELPRATVAREKMGKFLKAFDALNDVQEAQNEYEKKLSEGLSEAVEKTIEHLAKLAEKGEKLTSARDLMRTWYSVADKTLMQKFNTEEFLDVQNKLIDALMKHKTAQRDALEIVFNAMEIPTRSEIDEAYRDIHALKREVRVLRKALKEATGKAVQIRHGRKANEIEAPEAAAS
jgi:class III poly(R)-hydroxyalkanoic acid synthase PhaE subunit